MRKPYKDLTEKQKEHVRSYNRSYNKKKDEIAKSYIMEYKRLHPCEICGEKDHACLVFHHRNPNEKEYEISKIMSYGLETIIKEIEKCQVLYANCHSKLHYYQDYINMKKHS